MHWSSFESLSATLHPSHWSLHGGSAPDKCSDSFGANVCNGTNVVAQRNYPCDSIVIAYFGGAQTRLDEVGEQAMKAQLFHCLSGRSLLTAASVVRCVCRSAIIQAKRVQVRRWGARRHIVVTLSSVYDELAPAVRRALGLPPGQQCKIYFCRDKDQPQHALIKVDGTARRCSNASGTAGWATPACPSWSVLSLQTRLRSR